MKIIAVIQARMGSSRLPGKVLLKLAGKPVIEHVILRTKMSSLVDEVWLATTVNQKDDKLAEYAEKNNIRYFRGSEEDVLDRFYQVARMAGANIIVRITGDCPLIDGQLINDVINCIKGNDYDFVTNCVPATYPDGLDVEAVTFKTLEKVWREAKWASEREHAFSYIIRNKGSFKIGILENDIDYSGYRVTLDYPEDLRFLSLIIGQCEAENKFCGFKEITEIIESHPEWIKILDGKIRNDGYKKSINEDKLVK